MTHPYDRLLKELDTMSPEDVRIWLARNTKNDYPQFTYKYRATSTGEQQKNVQDMLVNGRIWLSSPDAFNDPFDMVINVQFDGTSKVKREAILAKLKKSRPSMTYKERQKTATQFMLRNHKETVQNVQAAFARHLSAVGVCSFSDDPENILMWSHYAQNHTGICVQFELAGAPSTLLVAHPINYTKEHPKANWAHDTYGQIRDAILSKADAWKYEKERRFFAVDKPNTLHALNPNAISGVIFGCRAPASVRSFVVQCNADRIANGHQPFRLYDAVQSKQEYKLSVEPIT